MTVLLGLFINSYFTEPLRKDSYLTIHQRNLKPLVTEVFKLKIAVANNIMKQIFEIDSIDIYLLKLKNRNIV